MSEPTLPCGQHLEAAILMPLNFLKDCTKHECAIYNLSLHFTTSINVTQVDFLKKRWRKWLGNYNSPNFLEKH
jgi:hypothetical protein